MSIRVEHTLGQLAAQYRTLPSRLRSQWPRVMTAVGVQMVSWAIDDYRARSEGRPAGDGSRWFPISRMTIAGRLIAAANTSAASGRGRIGMYGRRLLRRASKGGTPAMRAKVIYLLANNPQGLIQRLNRMPEQTYDVERKITRGKRRGQTETERVTVGEREVMQFHQLVQTEFASAKVGVDTGRLANSLTFGVPALRGIRFGGQRPKDVTPAVWRQSATAITVGTQQAYAAYYDRRRPIFAQGFLSKDRQESIQRLVAKLVEAITQGRG